MDATGQPLLPPGPLRVAIWLLGGLVALVALGSAMVAAVGRSPAASALGPIAASEAASEADLYRRASAPLDRARALALLDAGRSAAERFPLSSNAPFAIGVAQASLGDAAAAEAAMRITAERNPRNRVVRTWLADRAVREGDYAAALAQLDALMRVEPTLAPRITQAMVPFLLAPDMVGAFADVAAERPIWLDSFIDNARRNPRALSHTIALMRSIARREPEAVSDATVQAVIATSVTAGRYDDARALLEGFYPLGVIDRANLVVDPAFHGLAVPPPFGWSHDGAAGVVALGSPAGLRVTGRHAADATLVGQTLVLPPGRYTARITVDGRHSGRGLAWTLRCAEGGTLLGALDLGRLTGGARVAGTLRFAVPPRCGFVQLALTAQRTVDLNAEVRVRSVAIGRQP